MRKRGAISALAGACLLALPFLSPQTGQALDLTQRSVSTSRQFIIYCPDVGLRMAVTSFVETTKADVLEILGTGDHWKLPIVVNMERPSANEPASGPLCRVQLLNTEGGAKVEIDLTLRQEQFKEIRFPQQVIRAILLELAYREHLPGEGEHYVEPPAWLVEGLAVQLQTHASGSLPNAALFKQLIETGRLPKISDFLTSNVSVMDSTSRAIYGACASSLIDMLTGLPDGRASLGLMVRKINQPDSGASLLLKTFPALGGSEASLEKWWTLGLAHFSASDLYLTLDVPATDARLTPLLSLQIVTDAKKGTKETFQLGDYKAFLKYRTSRAALYTQASALAALEPKTHPLLRPVVLEYQRIASQLARGKTGGIDASLRAVGKYRAIIVERTDKISDYLNWFEATQMSEPSGDFDSYLKAANALENAPQPKRDDPLSRYIDQVEREFE